MSMNGPQKNPFPSRQRTSSLLWSCSRKIDGVRVPTGSTSPLFSRFGSLGLLLVPQYEEMAGGKEILFKRGSDCGNECLFCWVMPILLFRRDQQTGAALDKVYKLKRRLCCKIKKVCPKKLSSFHFRTDFSNHPLYCLESRSRGISYVKYAKGRRTGLLTFCVGTAFYNGLLKERYEGG